MRNWKKPIAAFLCAMLYFATGFIVGIMEEPMGLLLLFPLAFLLFFICLFD